MPGPKGGRPVALNNRWLEIAEAVINEPGVVIAWTDEDMIDEVNYRLSIWWEPHRTISQRTYERYKANFISKKEEEIEGLTIGNAISIERFWRLLKKKLRMEKLNILAHFSVDQKRQRRAWIFERKFTKDRALANPNATATGGGGKTTPEEDTAIAEVEVTILSPNHAHDESAA